MLTVWCLTVAFASPWVVGAPILWLLRGCTPLRPQDWLWAPFVGLAAIVCPLQSLVVFADLPLSRTTGWFWLATLVLWLVTLASRSGRASLRTIPRVIILISCGVYLGQGVGVVVSGVELFRGCMESDQYQYIVLAQFLMGEPFSTGLADLGDRPWILPPLCLKSDRIGQSVLHGFFAVTAGREAADLFYPTQLLGPGLLIPAVHLLAAQCGLSRRWAHWAALAAASAPGTEFLVTNCFLSHSLCMPTLVAFLAAAIRLSRGGGWRPLVGLTATFALGVGVYTEFAPLFVGTAGAALAAGLARRHIPVSRAAGVIAALGVALLLNLAATQSALAVGQRGVSAGAVMTTGCRTSVWVAAVWLHIEKAYTTGRMDGFTVAHAFVYAATAGAAVGAVVFAARAVRSRRRLLPSLACVSLLVPPLILKALRPESEYVIGKLVLTLAPILILFHACAAHAVLCRWPTHKRTVTAVFGCFLVMLVIQSGLEQRARQRGGKDSGAARVWNDADMQQLCAELRSQESTNLVVALPDNGDGKLPSAACGAVCYYARHHRIRVAAPDWIWMTPLPTNSPVRFPEGSAFPADAIVIRRQDTSIWIAPMAEVISRHGKYEIVRPGRPGMTSMDGPLRETSSSMTQR